MAHILDKKLFDLKLAAKQITRNAKKLKKEETREVQKCWRCVMRGEHDMGRVHAENAVRNHNQSLDLLTLGARLEGAVNVLQTAIIQNGVSMNSHHLLRTRVRNSVYGLSSIRNLLKNVRLFI